jgi:alkylation response protein AidB-like acyl-CoA dehydrogenase
MDLELSDEQALLQESFAGFFGKESSPERVRAAEPLGFDQVLWRDLVALGATAMGIPVRQGGGGATPLDLVLVAQEAGRRVAAVPFAETASAGNLLARAGSEESVAAILGGALPTLALRAPVNGRCRLVPAGAVADLVVALDGDELVVLRRAPAEDQPRVPAAPNFGSCPVADVGFDEPGAQRVVLASGPEARVLFEDALSEWKLLMAATLDGLRAAALTMTVDYVKARHAFGVPIGWFQSIQHRLADVTVAGDGARLLVYQAAWAREVGQADASELASMALLFLGELAFRTCAEGVQFHGGYGYTLEYDIQLYFRRAKAWPLALGDPRAEYQRLADRLYAAA